MRHPRPQESSVSIEFMKTFHNNKVVEVSVTRREFLKAQVMLPLVPLVACGLLSACSKDDSEESLKSVLIGKLSELKEGINRFPVLRVAVIKEMHEGSASLRTMSLRCTHQSCVVDNETVGEGFVCACHGSRFNSSGKVLRGPALWPLPSYRVAVENQDDVVYFPNSVVKSDWRLPISL